MDKDFLGTKKESRKTKDKDFSEKAGGWLNNYMGVLLALSISVIWLFGGFFNPSFNNVPIWIRLTSSALSIVVAVALSATLGMQGILNAMKLGEVNDLKAEHIKVISEANEYAEYADEWSDMENFNTKKRARTHILSEAGLKYSVYFDENGDYTGEEIPVPKATDKYTTHQHHMRLSKLNKALTINLTPQTFAAISTDTKMDYDEHAVEKTPEEFNRIQTAKKFASKLLTVTLLSFVTFEIITGRSAWESLFNGAMQLVIFLAFGVLDYLKNYNYVKNTYTQSLRRKISAANRLIAYGKLRRGEENGNRLQENSREPKNFGGPSERKPETTSPDFI